MSAPRPSAHVRLAFPTPEEAARMAAALAPDDDAFLRARVEGNELVLDAQADSPLGLLRALDEALATLGAAQKAARLAQDP